MYRGSLVRMGGECHLLPVLKAIREKIGKTFDDEVNIVVEEDTEPRVVVVPLDLQQALACNTEAEAAFRRLSFTHQREYVQCIEDAKREQTRQQRILRAMDLLAQGKKVR